ncbi:hypothetical protein BKA70DRAFT_1494715 [Coprinopsis sp. MPI-PUGE-AT-0042]|nr:hypothetical protein BKA70DRAFT_1494715 [Coprinopsis sp. MPI-PUGE-AT-0042]
MVKGVEHDMPTLEECVIVPRPKEVGVMWFYAAALTTLHGVHRTDLRNLTGKVAIVTGAGSRADGIGNGRACAILLAEAEFKIVQRFLETLGIMLQPDLAK